ncbi:MAG: oxygenase MpaB family protein [Mycobacterium sp.]
MSVQTHTRNDSPSVADNVRPKVIADFRKYTGSVLAGVFGGAFYDEVAFLPVAAAAVDTARLTRLPVPSMLPAAVRLPVTPLWLAVRPAAGRVMKVCSFGIMHPGVRKLTGFHWQPVHDVEFAFYTLLLQLAWRVLPDRLRLSPLAYNRLQYEKLVKLYRSVALDSYAPLGCPVG